MNLGELISKLLPITEQLISPGGVEGKLSQQRFRKKFALIIAFTGFILQFIVGIFNKDSIKNFPTYLANFIDFANLLLRGNWSLALRQYEIVVDLSGIFILFIGLSIYLFFSIRSSLKEYSEEPFQYTFWIEPFKHIKDTEKEQVKIEHEDRFHHLLHHDLMEKLNKRIRRLSLLDASKLDDAAKKNLVSHINIEGHYAIRKIKDDECVIHVMPRIRMGPPDNPATLANPIKYKLDDHSINLCKLELVETNKYNQIIERIYSNIATGIYKQIKTDLKEKINLFPTKYLSAVALYYEAEDFARSNTIDAYDYAIELYKESLRYFDITAFDRLTQYFIKFPVLWRYGRKFQHMLAKVEIGYAKCLIYRREISALSGRYKNPLFGIRDRLNEVIDNLSSIHDRINQKWNLSEKKEQNRLHTIMAFLTFPKDSWWRRILLKPNQTLFERQNHLLFDAYLVFAYAHNLLGAVQKAVEYLDNAKAVDPQLSEKSALYHLVAGTIEPNVDKALLLFRQSAELASDFQMAQYLLAYYSEMKFRMQEKISKDRVKSVIDEYDKVLELNPGNIASLAAQGYLYWLLGDLNKAKKKFEDGCEVKTISQQTFIGQLNYGLARIAAEKGDFNTSYDKYNEAISADPGVGAYSATTDRLSTAPYYDYIDSDMLERYNSYKRTVEYKIKELKPDKLSERTTDVVHSFVLNDYGNAYLNYFHRFKDIRRLEEAIKTFNQAIENYPENKIAHFSLQNAYMWRNAEGDIEKGIECLQKVKSQEGPIWPVAVIALVQSILRQKQEEIRKMMKEVMEEIKKADELEDKFRKSEYRRAGVSGEERLHVSQEPSKVPPSGRKKDTLDSTEIYKLQKEILEHREKADSDYKKIEWELSKCFENVLHEIEDNIKLTKMSSIYEGFEFNKDGQGVDKFLSEKKEIKSDKLDEYDIGALRFWAEVLSNNFLCEKARNAAKELCEYIEDEYYPNNFDTNLILYDMYRRVKDVNEIKSRLEMEGREAKVEECDKKIEHYTEIIKPTIENWLNRDSNKYTSFRWAEAFFDKDDLIKFYKKATKISVIQNKLGNILSEKGDYEKAIAHYTNATKLAFEEPIYECNLGRTFGDQRNWNKMIEHCSKAVELRRKAPTDAYGLDYYYDFLAEGYFKANKLKEFEELFEESGDFKDEPKKKAIIYNRIANLLVQGGQVQEGILYYEKAIKLDSGWPIYQCNLGLTYGKLPKPDWNKMIEHCSKAVELRRKAPTDAYGLDYYYDFLAEGYFKANKLKEFEELFEESGDFKDEPKKKAIIYNRIANLLAQGRKEEQAIIYYKKAIELDKESPIYECNLGSTYGKLPIPDLDKMIEHYNKAVELSRKIPDEYGLVSYYEYLSEGYSKANRLNEFIKLFEESSDLKDEPKKKARVYNRVGNLLALSQKEQEAIPYYKKAVEFDKESPIYECNLGLTYGKLPKPDWDKMIEHCKKAVELRRNAPTDPYGFDYYYGFLAEAYFKSGRLNEFEEFFEKSGDFKDEPKKKAIIYNRIANLLVQGGQVPESIPYYERAIRLDNKWPIYECNLGLTYGKLPIPDWDKIIEHCKKAVELRRNAPTDPYGFDYYYGFLAEAYFKSGRLNEFEKFFEKSDDLKNEPDKKAIVYNQIGNLFFGEYKYQKAIPYYKKAISLVDNIAVYHGNLGLAHRVLMKWDDAEAAFKRAASLEPNNAIHQNDLGNVYFEKGEYENAIPYYERAIKLDPNNAVYRENLEKCKKV